MASKGNKSKSQFHQALVDKLKSEGLIRTRRVESAFRAVPRHLFLPGLALDEVYRDQAIPTKHTDGEVTSSSSQPAIMAIMLEQLGLKPGQRVLEIGAGSGYNAALMAHIVGEKGQVITVDLDEDLVENAREHLAAAGFARVQVVCSDGGYGYPSAAPYDRIILTVGAWDITPAWNEQMKPDGRLVMPLVVRGGMQQAVAFERADDHLASISVSGCGFMKLRGAFAGPKTGTRIQFGPQPGLYIWFEENRSVDVGAIYKWFVGPSKDWPTTVRVLPREFGGLDLWLTLRETETCGLIAEAEMADRDILPWVSKAASKSKLYASGGLLGEDGLAVCIRPPDQASSIDHSDDCSPFELFVRGYGPDDTLAHRLIEEVMAWDKAGRPSGEILSIRAYAKDVDYVPSKNESVIPKRWTKIVVKWKHDFANMERVRG